MKKIITSVVALLVMGSVSFAQDAAKKAPAKKTDSKMAPKADKKMDDKKSDSKMAPKADKKMDAKKK